MAYTKIADIIAHDSFAQYVTQLTTEKSALVQSGVVAADPEIANRCSQSGFGGRTIALPFFNDLDGEDEVLDEDNPLGVNKVTAGEDVAVILRRGKAWGNKDLAADLAGKDPAAIIAARVANWKLRRQQAALFKLLDGVFADNVSNNDGDLVLDISGETGSAAVLGATTILLAAQKLGDASNNLTAIAMNSAASTALAALNADSKLYRPADAERHLAQYNGLNMIVDDAVPYDGDDKTATIYLFGAGAIALNECPERVPYEAGRDILNSQDVLAVRQAYIAHIRGVKWDPASGVPAKATPSNSELANGANWTRVYDRKHIRAVKLVCKLA